MSDDETATFGLIAWDVIVKQPAETVGSGIASGATTAWTATAGQATSFGKSVADRYTNMWSTAQADAALDANRNDDPGQAYAGGAIQTTGNARLTLSVPFPNTSIVLGNPSSDFGYPGLSMYADHYWFVEVQGRTRFQLAAPVTTVAGKQWWLYSMKDMAIGSDTNATFATRRRFILAAGGGYGAYPISDKGTSLADEAWSTADLEDILDPAHWGLRAFDEENEDVEREHVARFGHRIDKKPAVSPAAKKKKWLLEKLGGEKPEPTAHSERVARLLDLLPGWFGLIEKVGRIGDRIGRWLGRPDTIPIFGPTIFNHIKEYRNAEWAAKEGMSFMQVRTSGQRVGSAATHIDGLDSFEDFIGSLQDLVNRVKRLKNAVKELVLAVGNMLGFLAPNPSVLGLVGRDGVSMVTHSDVFAWAPSGFVFVSAPNAKDYPMDPITKLRHWALEKERGLKAKAGKFGNLLFGKENDPLVADPSFRVYTQDDVLFRAGRDFHVAAWKPNSRARIEGAAASELASTGPVGVTSRGASVEILGRTAVLGAPTADAKKAADNEELLAAKEIACETALKQIGTALGEAIDASYDLDAKKKKLTELETSRVAIAMGLPATAAAFAKVETDIAEAKVKIQEAKLNLEVKKMNHKVDMIAYELAKDSRDETAKAVGVGPTSSNIAKAMRWDPTKQVVAQEASVAAVKEIGVFGGKKVAIESRKAVEIAVEAKTPPSKATIKVDTAIELLVGNFKVTVTKEKVTIHNGAIDVAVVDQNGIVLKSPGEAKVSVTGPDVKLEAKANANITANGKILVG